jgi:hypothetical protein
VLDRAERLSGPDPKLESLLQVIRDKQVLPNNKLLLFSSFRHTLAYLYQGLTAGELRVGLVHGQTPDEVRRDLRQRFAFPREDPNAIDVLLSSEIGSEGLDYQFCDCLVNYDLPWNPMRVEQRIGRIDRYGQKSEAVAIYNFVTPGTVDADIYFRCLLRIGIFQAALGGSEEILGRLGQGIRRIAEDLTLSAEERSARLEQLADNEVRTLQEQMLIEEQQGAFFGITLPPDQVDREVADAESAWLSPHALEALVQIYLARLGSGEAVLLGAGPRQTLRASQDDRTALLADLRSLAPNRSPVFKQWERWLKGGDPHLPLTFDSVYAAEHRSTVFITPIHPLAQQAARSVLSAQPVFVAFRASDDMIPSGEYPFAIYQWQTHGVRTSATFQPICENELVQSSFFTLLSQGSPVSEGEIRWPKQSVFDSLDAQQYALWVEYREQHRAGTRRTVNYRRESLSKSHQARVALLQEQLRSANHPNLQRMRQSQIADAEAEYARRSQELNTSQSAADVVSRPVAFGSILIS